MLRLTRDTAGNLLIPIDWRGVLLQDDQVPIARLVSGEIRLEAFKGMGIPVRVPDLSVLASFSPEGIRLPPLFDPHVDPSDPNVLTLFATADAARGPDRAPAALIGTDTACTREAECGAGACDRGLFDFSDRFAAGTGPIVIRRDVCADGVLHGAACTTDADCGGGH